MRCLKRLAVCTSMERGASGFLAPGFQNAIAPTASNTSPHQHDVCIVPADRKESLFYSIYTVCMKLKPAPGGARTGGLDLATVATVALPAFPSRVGREAPVFLGVF